jgi:predicted acyl esterase
LAALVSAQNVQIRDSARLDQIRALGRPDRRLFARLPPNCRSRSAHKWLQVHGGRHKEWFYLPESLTLPRRFFDCFLKGAGNDWLAAPQIQLHIRRLGERFELRTEHEWPLARTRWTDLCLDAATHRMHDERPESQSSFTFAALGQGVTFRTGPLPAQTELTGPVAAALYMSSSTADADIFVTLQAFLADGSEVVFDGASDPAAPLAQGCLRLSHRHTDPARSARWQPFHTHDRIEPAQPGRSTASTPSSGPPASSCPRRHARPHRQRARLRARHRLHHHRPQAPHRPRIRHIRALRPPRPARLLLPVIAAHTALRSSTFLGR